MKKTIQSIAFFDQDGLEVSRHNLQGLVLLALPSAQEQIIVGANEQKGTALLKIEAGDPLIVLNLMNVLSKMLPDMMAKTAQSLQKGENGRG